MTYSNYNIQIEVADGLIIPTKTSQLTNDSGFLTESSGGVGPQGPQGFQGIDGAQGPQGFQGTTGSQGIDGAQNSSALSSGITAPNSTPSKIGDIYVDTLLKQTYIANGSASSANWIKQNGSYSMQIFNSSALSPADGETYWMAGFATVLQGATYSGLRRMYVGRGGTLKSTYLQTNVGSVGTSEQVSIYIRVNNTTDYLLSSSVIYDATLGYFAFTGLNIPLNAGDYFVIKIVCPTWATNPLSIGMTFQLHIDI